MDRSLMTLISGWGHGLWSFVFHIWLLLFLVIGVGAREKCRSRHLVIWSRNHEYSVLSRKDLWSYYQSMSAEFRNALGKVLVTQDSPTLRLASHHCVLRFNLIKNMFNTCIYTHIHTSIHLNIQSWHHSSQNTYLSTFKQKRAKYRTNPSIHLT